MTKRVKDIIYVAQDTNLRVLFIVDHSCKKPPLPTVDLVNPASFMGCILAFMSTKQSIIASAAMVGLCLTDTFSREVEYQASQSEILSKGLGRLVLHIFNTTTSFFTVLYRFL